jgi:hypothetical protein
MTRNGYPPTRQQNEIRQGGLNLFACSSVDSGAKPNFEDPQAMSNRESGTGFKRSLQ